MTSISTVQNALVALSAIGFEPSPKAASALAALASIPSHEAAQRDALGRVESAAIEGDADALRTAIIDYTVAASTNGPETATLILARNAAENVVAALVAGEIDDAGWRLVASMYDDAGARLHAAISVTGDPAAIGLSTIAKLTAKGREAASSIPDLERELDRLLGLMATIVGMRKTCNLKLPLHALGLAAAPGADYDLVLSAWSERRFIGVVVAGGGLQAPGSPLAWGPYQATEVQ